MRRTYDVSMQIRVTRDQMTSFEIAAAADGRTVSGWARHQLELAARQATTGHNQENDQ